MNNCVICNTKLDKIFKTKVLNKYEVEYFLCPCCGLLQTEKPYWINEAYESSINDTDLGLLQRNLSLMKISKKIINYGFNREGKFLDFAAGYGLFVRLMRDYGYDFYWQDLYTENIFAKGFEYNGEKIDLITTFESFEHFVNPIEEIEKLFKISKNILFSTELYPEPIPHPDKWWYYASFHGQHIVFYSKKTFKYIANKYGLYYYTNGKNIHLLTEKKISNLYLKIIFFQNNIQTYFSKTSFFIKRDVGMLTTKIK
ncbi:MAG: class I SAM-dependent methyltransferase [Bacteroidales bacterium]|nr:class I SAM-dependent methyltransferase [Bacteroidales bacterium]